MDGIGLKIGAPTCPCGGDSPLALDGAEIMPCAVKRVLICQHPGAYLPFPVSACEQCISSGGSAAPGPAHVYMPDLSAAFSVLLLLAVALEFSQESLPGVLVAG